MYFFIFPKVVMEDSIKDAMLVFTGGSSSRRTVFNGKGYVVQTAPASVHIVVLRAVAIVF